MEMRGLRPENFYGKIPHQRHLDFAAEVQRQRGKTGDGIIVLAGQVFYG